MVISGSRRQTDQLVQVVLDSGQVREGADGHQAAQRKVKQLIAKERDEPAITILLERENVS